MKLSQRLASRQQNLERVRLPDRYVPWQQWGPDYSPLNIDGLFRAENVIPVPNGLGPIQKLTPQTNALDSRVYGGLAVDGGEGAWLYFAGTKTKLYVGAGGIFDDASKVGDYGLLEDQSWKFLDWGDQVLATNINDPLQVATAQASVTFDDAFTGTRRPQAKYMAVVADRLVLANTQDIIDGSQPRRIWWGALGDFTNMDPDPSTGANFVDRLDGGEITGIVGGKEFGLVFQTQRILRIDPIGGSAVFQITPLDTQRGSPYPNSITAYGRRTFFMTEEGLYYNDGSNSVNISYGKVQRYLWDIYDTNNPNDISVSFGRRGNAMLIALPQNNSAKKRVFIYNMQDGRWTETEQDIEILIEFRKLGFTIDSMDPAYPDLDAVPFSLDNDFWRGGALETGAFDTNHTLGTFTGPNLSVTLITNLYTGQTGAGLSDRASTTRAWPLIHGQQLGSMRLIRRNELFRDDTVGAPPLVGPWVTISRGRTRFVTQNEARYHQIELFIPEGSDWSMIEGVNIEMSRVGGRIG